MDFHNASALELATRLESDIHYGLTSSARDKNERKYGKNLITKKKRQSFFVRLFLAMKEPMIIILAFSFLLALITNIGKFIKSGDGDFIECVGILLAIILSVSITLIMESSSERAFNALNKIYDSLLVKIIRQGQILTVRQEDIVVGDIVFLSSGDKIVADGRLIESNSLYVDESALTGESIASLKRADEILSNSVPLAERKNCVYSGTFVTAGSGKMIVCAVGNETEIGKIAGELSVKIGENSPLQDKLSRLGKTISLIGALSAVIVFLVSIIKLISTNSLTFDSVQELFVSSIILIVAAVPEGLPTIVAMSLAVNMIKLAGENVLIKKITATETAGAVSVICSDKTGTLTQNKMKVVSICFNQNCVTPDKKFNENLKQNFVCNSTADIVKINEKLTAKGDGTECALINAYVKNGKVEDYEIYRKNFPVLDRQPFSSDNKFMTTTIKTINGARILLKGAPEVVLNKCALTEGQKRKLLADMETHQKQARRVICFAHFDGEKVVGEQYSYDGFAAIADPIRKEVFQAVKECKRAGIKIKILTGDNKTTAFAIAKELKIATDESQVALASDLENLDENTLQKTLKRITVIARSTPIIKLRIVKALKNIGEVVAVTGDGINDAPAIKQADVGIAMGKVGSEITKEAADVVLLDDSFSSVVKAVSFGRNVYRNLQRFILFQLSVNLSALLFITICAVMGLETPFNTFQLLWINVIMDGPPALTLGLEQASGKLLNNKPVQKSDGIVSIKMLVRIIINGVVIGGIMLSQYLFNFLNVEQSEKSSAVFTLFILFQLFNAFNCRELGAESIFKSIGKNKIMVITFLTVFIIHVVIVQLCYSVFAISPMSLSSWIKTISLSSLIIVVSEIYKLAYRLIKSYKKRWKFDEIQLKTNLKV